MIAYFGLLLIALMGFAALVTDAGLLYMERRHLQNTADAAALAGARQFLSDGWSETDVVDAAHQWAEYNGVSTSEITGISIGAKSLPAGELPTVTVTAQRQVNLLFAFAFGIRQMPVGVRAVAGVTPLRPINIWPWSISVSTYEALVAEQAALGENGEVYLKLASQDNASGNFLPLALGGGTGASSYYDNIINGYDGPLPVQVPSGAWIIPTETGNMAGPTSAGVDYLQDQPACTLPNNDLRCPLIGLIPVVTDESWNAANGRSSDVAVVRFPIFKVKGLALDPDQKGQGKGHQVVVGQFMESGVAVGPSDPDSTIQLFGIRLWD